MPTNGDAGILMLQRLANAITLIDGLVAFMLRDI
jgi:hypothetical protein